MLLHKHFLNEVYDMKKILIIDNGGTVSMKRTDGVLVPVDSTEDIRKSIFELKETIDTFYTRVNQVDSTNLYPEIMKRVYDEIVENYGAYDGFVVLTGTDTLAYLASFLSFWLRDIHKPVVITGSQKPLNMLGSDAPANIYYSILFACEDITEVTVFFGKRLFRGNRVTKFDTQDFDAFKSPNYPAIGHVDAVRHRIHHFIQGLLRSPDKEMFRYAWSPDVHIVSLYPGFNPEILKLLPELGYRGVIIEAYGMGNLPNEGPYSLVNAIREIVNKKMVVAVTSRCLRGAVQVEYDTARTFQDLGVVFLRDITKEAAYAKMSYLFGLSKNPEEVRENMTISLVGEMQEYDSD
jgi:L-asparaginase